MRFPFGKRWLRRRREQWLAIAPVAGEWAVMRLVADGNGVRMQAYRSYKPDETALLRVPAQQQVTTLLDAGDYRLLQLEAPNVAPDELQAAVRWRLREMLDGPVDDLIVDVICIPNGPSGLGRPALLIAVTAHTNVVRGRTEAFREARLKLDAIDIPELALRNIATLFETQGEAVVLLWFDQQHGHLLLVYQGELYMWRTLDGAAPGMDQPQRLERIVREIRRTLDHVSHHFSDLEPGRIVVLAPYAATALLEYLAEHIDLPVVEGDLTTVISGLTDFVPERVRQVELSPLIGAALRRSGGRA